MITQHSAARPMSASQFLPSSLRAFILAGSYWVISIPLTTTSGSAAAFIGSLLVCLLVDKAILRKPLVDLRGSSILTIAILALAAAVALSNVFKSSDLLVGLLGAMPSFVAAEIILWLFIGMVSAGLLRVLAYRRDYGRVVEILFVAAAFVVTLAAHRQGMIHRPFFIGDFALVRGIDPSSILMAVGCAAVLSLSALLIMENNHRRLPYHFSVLGLLCFSLIIYIQFFGMPTPRLTDDLGLTGQARNSGSGQNESPFSDGENNGVNREAPIAIVLFRDDYEPESGAYYFRESAYSQFNGNVLVAASRNDLDRDLIEYFPSSRVDVSEPIPAQGMRQSVRTTIGLLTAHRTPFGLDTPVAFANVPNPNDMRFKQTYDAWSLVPQFDFPDLLDRQAGSSTWTVTQWQEYLAMPDDPRYQLLAEEILQDLRPEFADDPYAKALIVKGYLDQNGIYSLANEHAYASDPAASFLFGDLTGYCMHFAFAATYLYRSIGIPARVGIGYSVPAGNRAGGSALLIQAVHGHAWPEIYLEDIGWIIVDPTPAQSLVDMSTDPQDGLQQLLGDMLRDEADFQEFLAANQNSLIDLDVLMRVVYLLLIVALLSGYLVKIYRLSIPRLARSEQHYRLSYRAALDWLAAMGMHRRYGESREAFARRVSDLTPSFMQLTSSHVRQALRSQAGSSDALRNISSDVAGSSKQDWTQLRKQVHHELRKALPFWRRLLAWLNPFSWLTTR